MSDQICQQTWRRKYYEGNFLKSRDWKIRPLEYLTRRKDELIQIVHRNHHWIVVGGKEEEITVEIYDSLANGSTKKEDSISNMSAPATQ